VTDTSRLDRADDRRHQGGRLPCRPFLRLGAAVLALLLGAATRADASDRVALVLPLSGARTTETAAAERAVRDAALAIGTGPARLSRPSTSRSTTTAAPRLEPLTRHAGSWRNAWPS